MQRRYHCFIIMMLVLGGCSSTTGNYQNRPFFLAEENIANHGRKNWFDRIIETDPGSTDQTIATDYQKNPPLRIAVLPFVDHGTGEYLVDGIPLGFRKTDGELDRIAWTRANRVRRSVSGEIGGREFEVIPLVAIDAVLADRGIDDWNELLSVPPEKLGRWLDADAIVYGEILSYEAYWAGLISAWRVNARCRADDHPQLARPSASAERRRGAHCRSARYRYDGCIRCDRDSDHRARS